MYEIKITHLKQVRIVIDSKSAMNDIKYPI